MLRKLTALVLVVFTFSLQSTLGNILPGIPAVPNFLLILTCYFGFTGEKQNGMVTGVAAGLLVDLFYGSFIGPYTILYMVIGYVSGLFRYVFYEEDIMWPMCWLAVCEFIYNFILYVFRFLLQNKLDFGSYFTSSIMPELVITVITGVILYWPILKCNQFFDVFEDRSKKNLD